MSLPQPEAAKLMRELSWEERDRLIAAGENVVDARRMAGKPRTRLHVAPTL